MSDWIANLRKEHDESSRKKKIEEETALLNSRMVDAKLPDFFVAVSACVESYAARLRQIFPDVETYQTEFTGTDSSFVLQQVYFPTRKIEVRIDREGQRIKFDRSSQEPGNMPGEVTVLVDNGSRIYVRLGILTFSKPEDLAEWFIRKTCGIM